MPSAITSQEQILDTTLNLIFGTLTPKVFYRFFNIYKIIDFNYEYFSNMKPIQPIRINKINRRQYEWQIK